MASESPLDLDLLKLAIATFGIRSLRRESADALIKECERLREEVKTLTTENSRLASLAAFASRHCLDDRGEPMASPESASSFCPHCCSCPSPVAKSWAGVRGWICLECGGRVRETLLREEVVTNG